MDGHRLGALLLENGLVGEQDLERCLEIQRLTGGMRPIGQILVEEGLLSAEGLEQLLALQSARRGAAAASPAPAGEDADRWLHAAASAGASELVLSSGRPPGMRVAGTMRGLGDHPLEVAAVWDHLRRYAGSEAEAVVRSGGCATALLGQTSLARGRIEAFSHLDGPAVVLRLHPATGRRLADLGLEGPLGEVLRAGTGLVLVAGNARSGVSETLGAALQEAAQDRDRLVLVLDETLEHEVPEGGAIVVQRRIGTDVPDARSALQGALAQEANVVLVGRVADGPTLDACLDAAASEQLVLAGVSARSATAALRRVMSMCGPREGARIRRSLAAILQAVVAVRLLPSSDQTRSVLASELLLMDDAVREVVREGALAQLTLLMRLEGIECGHAMDDSLLALVRDEQVPVQDAFANAEDKTAMLEALRSKD